MYNVIRQGDTDQYGLTSYVCDELTDIESLPTDCAAGSSCLVIENSSVWMLNSKQQWCEI